MVNTCWCFPFELIIKGLHQQSIHAWKHFDLSKQEKHRWTNINNGCIPFRWANCGIVHALSRISLSGTHAYTFFAVHDNAATHSSYRNSVTQNYRKHLRPSLECLWDPVDRALPSDLCLPEDRAGKIKKVRNMQRVRQVKINTPLEINLRTIKRSYLHYSSKKVS